MEVSINVSAPAGPPPDGALVETSVPFPSGAVFAADGLMVRSPSGRSVPVQFRPAMRWPDSSVRWLHVLFEAEDGPGSYTLCGGRSPKLDALLSEEDAAVKLSSGVMCVRVPREGGLLDASEDGQQADLVLTRRDGKRFRASLAGDSRTIIVEECGPLRASVRIEGRCRAEEGEGLFSYIVRVQVYSSRPEIALSVTWINADDSPGEFVRDIRFVLPHSVRPDRLVIACETGMYDGPLLADWPVHVLQDDLNHYVVRAATRGGRVLNLSSGGCNGARCPGYLRIRNETLGTGLGVWVPEFRESYPNEIEVDDRQIAVGLWPERAARRLATQETLSRDPDGGRPYEHARYWPLIPHPYLAFFDAETGCLDAPQGLARTQEIVLSVERPHQASSEGRWRAGVLRPVRGVVNPATVAASGALGQLWPHDPAQFPEAERVYEECFRWFDRHGELFGCYGKFDYGDFRYVVFATDYHCHPGTKWGDKGEMPREGYWHNNERDVLRALLLHHLRTGDRRAWELCRVVARHTLDVDIRHHPHWGMYTHSYGHCYNALGRGGEPDHSWLLGLLEWAGASGDPLAWEWTLRCGDFLEAQSRDFSRADARTASVHAHMMVQFHRYTGEARFLEAAEPAIRALLAEQKPDGSWPAYLGVPDSIIGFVEHVVMALADYHSVTGDDACRQALLRAVEWFRADEANAFDIGEGGLTMYALSLLWEQTRAPECIELIEHAFRTLAERQNLSPDPIGRGDFSAAWGVPESSQQQPEQRPPQFLGQTRPVTPATILSYTPCALWALASASRERKEVR